MARIGVAIVLIAGFALCACGGDDESSGSGGDAGNAGAAGGSGGSGGAFACSAPPIEPGTVTETITVGGIERQYLLHVPPSYDGKSALPLILNFHGFTSNMGQQALFSAMNGTSDADGFIVVYPNGLANPGGDQQSWNAGACCAYGDTDRDDVGFVDAMLDDLASKLCIDQKRVYATGMSNGGFMSHFLACERANRFAAIGPVAGVLGIAPENCKPSRAIPVIHFHGTADTFVPYDGSAVWGFPSVPDTIAGWVSRNACTGQATQTFSNGAAHCDTTAGCRDGVEVVLCTIDGMAHCWPGQSFCPFGAASTDISANDAMWEFFEKFALP